MVAKAIVVRKSLGPKRPYGFESHPRHEKKTALALSFLCLTVRLQNRETDNDLSNERYVFSAFKTELLIPTIFFCIPWA